MSGSRSKKRHRRLARARLRRHDRETFTRVGKRLRRRRGA